MANVHWHLKTPDAKGNRIVFMFTKYPKSPNGFKYYPSVTISGAAKWDGKTIKQGPDYEKKKILQGFEDVFDSVFSEAYPGTPEPDILKLRLDEYKASIKKQEPDEEPKPAKVTFYTLFEAVAKQADKETTTDNRLAVMERMKRKWETLEFKNITTEWLEEFREWIKEDYRTRTNSKGKLKHPNKEIKTSSVNAYLQLIKRVVKSDVKKRYFKENPFDEFKLKKESDGDKDAISLTKEELKILVDWKKPNGKPLPELSKSLEGIKDMFVIGCLSGLRSEDLRRLGPEHVVLINKQWTFKIQTSKTGAMFVYPVHPEILKIFKKYGVKKFPKKIGTQWFNVCIKEICQLAGLNEVGVLATNPDWAVWQCVQAHTARRTFVTLALYEFKIPAAQVIKWSLHKTESMLWQYAKPRQLQSTDSALAMQSMW